MSGAPRTSKAASRERPSALRTVLRTILVSVVVLALGYVTGLVAGHELL